jgi:hypothetical protein
LLLLLSGIGAGPLGLTRSSFRSGSLHEFTSIACTGRLLDRVSRSDLGLISRMHRHSLSTLVADGSLAINNIPSATSVLSEWRCIREISPKSERETRSRSRPAPAMVYILRLQGGSTAAQTGLLSVGDAVGRNAGSRGAHVAGATLIDGHGPARSRKVEGTIMQPASPTLRSPVCAAVLPPCNRRI